MRKYKVTARFANQSKEESIPADEFIRKHRDRLIENYRKALSA